MIALKAKHIDSPRNTTRKGREASSYVPNLTNNLEGLYGKILRSREFSWMGRPPGRREALITSPPPPPEVHGRKTEVPLGQKDQQHVPYSTSGKKLQQFFSNTNLKQKKKHARDTCTPQKRAVVCGYNKLRKCIRYVCASETSNKAGYKQTQRE